MTTLTFHFDYLSPYAYFAWLRVETFCANQGLELEPRPVLLAALLNHWGHLGPAELPPKREFVFKDAVRYAARNGIELAFPKYHPFNPLTALRVSTAVVAGQHQAKVIHALFRASWGMGVDIGDPEVVADVLAEAGLDGAQMVNMAKTQPMKDALRSSCQQAIAEGVFGVPTMLIDGELFWGNDQFQNVREFVDGKDPVDQDWLDALSTSKSSAVRPRAKK